MKYYIAFAVVASLRMLIGSGSEVAWTLITLAVFGLTDAFIPCALFLEDVIIGKDAVQRRRDFKKGD